MEKLNKSQDLKKLIEDLSTEISLTEENLDSYLKRFKNIYSDGFRHEYSEITRILFLLNDNQDSRDFMSSKIKDIYDKSQYLYGDCETTKSLKKLKDHVNLENIRIEELIKISKKATCASEIAADLEVKSNDTKNIMEELQKKLSNLNIEVERSEKNLEIIQERIKNNTTESITILSIFAGIVMAFSGGMSFVSNAISGINKIEPYRLSVFILIIGAIMFNTIFLLLYMVGKIINKYTGSESICYKPKEMCKKKKFSCYVIKYPYIVWFNFLICICIISCLYLSFLDRFNIFTRILLGQKMWWTTIILGVILFILFLVIGIRLKNIKCTYKNN